MLHVVSCSWTASCPRRSLSELEGFRVGGDMGDKIRQVTERATLFRITSNAMINVSSPDLKTSTLLHLTVTLLTCFCLIP